MYAFFPSISKAAKQTPVDCARDVASELIQRRGWKKQAPEGKDLGRQLSICLRATTYPSFAHFLTHRIRSTGLVGWRSKVSQSFRRIQISQKEFSAAFSRPELRKNRRKKAIGMPFAFLLRQCNDRARPSRMYAPALIRAFKRLCNAL